jgi:3-oxoacyl-[acyl-carrier protein] reductase
MSSKHLKGRTAVVTGAGRGIGRSIALKLASEGANIAFNYFSNEESAKSLCDEISQLGVTALSFKVDIKDYKAVQDMKNAILEKFGTFDILINNAGITKDSALVMLSEEKWDDVIGTNLKGTFNMTKAAIFTFMKQKSGNIINISSLSGVIGIAGQTNYSASKGGIISFTKALAREVAPMNIRVNAIAPGFIETEMTSSLKQDQLKERIPLGRFGRADEVAEVANFLLSKEANYITGQVIRIDGGLGI